MEGQSWSCDSPILASYCMLGPYWLVMCVANIVAGALFYPTTGKLHTPQAPLSTMDSPWLDQNSTKLLQIQVRVHTLQYYFR